MQSLLDQHTSREFFAASDKLPQQGVLDFIAFQAGRKRQRGHPCVHQHRSTEHCNTLLLSYAKEVCGAAPVISTPLVCLVPSL